MNQDSPQQHVPRSQFLAERAFQTLERFLHIEAVSGIALLVAAAAALIWANSPVADSYHHLWHTPLSIGVGSFIYSQSLHFWINDALMTVFFLVVGMEIRREIHEGALSDLRQAALPLMAALGGVVAPALIYLAFNAHSDLQRGWAIPTATDIAFAVGVLALLGKSIPANIRIFLLALAIIDDIVAVLIIALFYSDGLDISGLLIAGFGVLMVLGFQKIGIGSAYGYVLPGAILWVGMLKSGAHPTLAGVVLGLLTPVTSMRTREQPLAILTRTASELSEKVLGSNTEPNQLVSPLKQLRFAQREILAPVTRVQMALHPWVAYGVMPLFALANAGVTLDGIDLSLNSAQRVMFGIVAALVIGKPLGVVGASWIAVKLRICRLPPNTDWSGILLVGLLAGIGFTMSIFIAMLAFSDEALLGAAKMGVLIASVVAGVIGLLWGSVYTRRRKAKIASV
ncbi:MAG: Na+/H+ antiporter NhaA [Verrucomicrobiaceae bacterium]|nr:Na+/H+ antiporter NhaA [Verrucomicrobiaceae bacterium]